MKLFRGDAEVTTVRPLGRVSEAKHERARPVTTAPWDAERSTGSSDAPRERASFKTPIVYVGMSGGVDSSVSVALLKQQGYHVVGAYMKNWSRDLPGMKCPWAEDLADAKRIAVKLGIDFEVFDFENEYKQKVVDYMLDEFKKGRTPNPDIMCNQEIKFKLFYDVARENGADFIATGHYARIGAVKPSFEGDAEVTTVRPLGRVSEAKHERRSPVTTAPWDAEGRRPTGRADAPRERMDLSSYSLLRATDSNKDQTYFLYRISQDAINHTIFPIGHLMKPEVKKLAEKFGFDNAYKKESMGVCFVGDVGIRDFLKEFIETEPGPIIDIDTKQEIGLHDGAILYTIGQRKGLNLGGGLPYYVVDKDMAKNIVYVSQNLNSPSLWTDELTLEDIILRPNNHADVGKDMKIATRLRHRGPLISAILKGNVLHFDQPIKRPGSGQSAVFYGGPNAEICLGGGIIK